MTETSPAARVWQRPRTWMLVAAVALAALVVRPLALELFIGLVFGYVSERPIDWVLRAVGRRSEAWRWAASGAFVTVASLVLLVPAAIAVWVALHELARLLNGADLGHLAALPARLSVWLRAKSGGALDALPTGTISTRGRQWIEGAGGTLARATARGLSATPRVLFSVLVSLCAWVSFAASGRALREAVVPRIIPWAREREILQRTTADVIEGVVLANLGVSVVQAAIISITTLALRVPHAIVWGVASFVLSFIPVIGTALVTVSATIWLAASGRVGAAVVMGVAALIAGSIDNILRPLLARGSSALPLVWMMAAFFGGVSAFGPAGIVLGPLVLAWTVALWRDHDPITG